MMRLWCGGLGWCMLFPPPSSSSSFLLRIGMEIVLAEFVLIGRTSWGRGVENVWRLPVSRILSLFVPGLTTKGAVAMVLWFSLIYDLWH